MAFMRSATAKTFVSRGWSTDSLADGLKHILNDGDMDLPDDLSSLKDCFS